MSELTPCNHCNLRMYRRTAAKLGKVVTLVPDGDPKHFPEGVAVLVHPAGEEPDRERHRVAWFGALTDYCVC